MSNPSKPEASNFFANPQIQQDVKGDRNQVVGQAIDSTIINTVGTLNQITQQLARSPEAARYSLPVDAADFTGRGGEIEQIEADLRDGLAVSIVGMAGVGKSALAVRVAHRIKAQFPGGQLYLNLRGADTQPLTVEAALETLLRALGVDPAQMPTERSQQAAMYRSRMVDAPTLVLLDNAADARQVEDLLPGAGACLITSRRQLDGLAGVKTSNLDALPEAEALELLGKVVSPERVQADAAAARQIVGYCGGLPVALRIAAATLAMRSWQEKRLATYTQQLADERQRLDRLKLENLDIRASFELSYRELNPSAAHLLGWLGLLPTDFGTAILEPLTKEPESSVQQALAALVDGRLVDPHNPATGERYILHDLMRLFALEKLEAEASPEAIQAATVRLVQWCVAQANSWADALRPVSRRQWAEALAAKRATHEPDTATPAVDLEPRLLRAALKWFEAERETLVQAFNWAAETQQWTASVALAASLAHFFNLRSYWGDWVSTHQQALTAAQQAGDPRGKGATLNNFGMVYEVQGKWKEAIECYKQSLTIFRANGDVHIEGTILNNLGLVYKAQGKWKEAIECYKQSLTICRESGDVHVKGTAIMNLGAVYQVQGEWKEAIECYKQSLTICWESGNVHGEGQTLNNLGNVYKDQGKWEEAIECYKQSLTICRESGDVHVKGTAIMNLGTVYQVQGEWKEAIECYKQSLTICWESGNVHGEGQTLNNLGNVYKDQGKWEEAIECYKQSLTICRESGDVHVKGTAIMNLGTVYQVQGEWKEAIECYKQSLTICRESGNVHGEGQTLNNLGNVYKDQGKWNEAIECYKQSLTIFRASNDVHDGDVHGEGTILANLGIVYELQNHLDQAIAQWQEARKKLHPDSPEYATVTQWLQAATQPRRPAWLGWLLPLAILLFLGWNLVNGHWLIALLGVLALAGWQWFRRRR